MALKPKAPDGIQDLRMEPSQAEFERMEEERKTRFKKHLKIFFFFVAAYYVITASYDFFMDLYYPERALAQQSNNPLNDATRFRQGINLVLRQENPEAVLPVYTENEHGFTLAFNSKDKITAVNFPETKSLYNASINIVVDNEQGILSSEEYAALHALITTCEKLFKPTAPDTIADVILNELGLSKDKPVDESTKESTSGYEYRLIVSKVNLNAHSDVPGLQSQQRKVLSLSATPKSNL